MVNRHNIFVKSKEPVGKQALNLHIQVTHQGLEYHPPCGDSEPKGSVSRRLTRDSNIIPLWGL